MSEAKSGTKLSKSELELGEKWDRCLIDSLVKFGSGVGLGIVFSVVLFRRRPWPVIFGSGIGIGMAYANCQHDFQQPFKDRSDVVKVTDSKIIEAIKSSTKN